MTSVAVHQSLRPGYAAGFIVSSMISVPAKLMVVLRRLRY